MKRIVAKEFLLLVTCSAAVLLVALYSWVRNIWFKHRADNLSYELAIQSDSLSQISLRAAPQHLDFLELFEPDFVQSNYDVFLEAPFWTTDPWLRKASTQDQKRTLAEIADELLSRSHNEGRLTRKDASPSRSADDILPGEDPFAEFGGEQVFPIPPSRMNRRYLICIAKALDSQNYLTPDRLDQLAGRCEGLASDVDELDAQLDSARTLYLNIPSANRITAALKKAKNKANIADERKLTAAYNHAIANDVYNESSAWDWPTTWKDALIRRGVPKDAITAIYQQDSATTGSIPLLLAMRGFLCDTADFAELRDAFVYLKARRVLRCTVDDLLCTLQNKAVPPSKMALNAVTQQRAVVAELQKELNDARASLWSEAIQLAVVKWASVVLFVLVWPLRLIVLGTRWALRVLRA